MRIVLQALAMALVATTAAAGGTRVQAPISPLPQDCQPVACQTGACQFIGGACATNADCTRCERTRENCTSNADCDYAPVSGKSKIQFLGTGQFKLSFQGLMSSIDTPATTDGITGTSDDYFFGILMFNTSGTNLTTVLKVDANGGKGKLDVDLSSVMPANGVGAFMLGYLLRPSGDPTLCPGSGNSPDEIAARVGNPACVSGTSLGAIGFSSGDKTSKFKSTISPFLQTCRTDYVCTTGSCNGPGGACTTNADCNSCSLNAGPCTSNADCDKGSPSPKSKIQINGAGQLKVTIKEASDGAGGFITTDGIVNTADDYILQLVFNPFAGPTSSANVKVDFKNGNATINADLSGVIPAAGIPANVFGLLLSPPDVPADCPGTNSPADIVARATTGACITGDPRAVIGVESGS